VDKLIFAENIKYLREEILRIPQAEIPDAIGFSRTTWSGYERAASVPSLEDLVKISQLFGISEYDLLHTELNETLPLIHNGIDENLVKKYNINPHKNAHSGGSNPEKETPEAKKHAKVPPPEQVNASPIARNLQAQSPLNTYKIPSQPQQFLHEQGAKYGMNNQENDTIDDQEIIARIALLEANQKKIMKKLGIK